MNEERSPKAEVGPGQGQIVKILYEDRHRALRELLQAVAHPRALRSFDDRTGPFVDEVVAAARAVMVQVGHLPIAEFGTLWNSYADLEAALVALDEEAAR